MVYVPEHFEEKDQKEIQKIIDNFLIKNNP